VQGDQIITAAASAAITEAPSPGLTPMTITYSGTAKSQPPIS
jgi:hypothetical protein